jgi:Asp-tRNA(Asn)/Glu-tRNA(Gln) amidotransferase A subunit family amidase
MLDRRRFLALASAAAPAGLLLGEEAKGEDALARALAGAEELFGLEFSREERALMLEGLEDQREDYRKLREVHLDNSVPPALRFDPDLRPEPGEAAPARNGAFRWSDPAPGAVPADLEELAFWPVSRLAPLVREGRVRSVDLTRLYLGRLKRLDPKILAVVTLTEERALEAAERADREIAAGTYRGPLHGIPWGAKDLLATRGYRTTWGSVPFKEQVIDEDAAVVERLDRAGAVLVAKLSLGELAMGDVWFGGMTRNPWNLEQGSSGSSAGSAAATVAGGVGFSIGSETLGSIVSPCTRTGATGLRPTFGRVPRSGAMTLCWSLDKLGPIGRSVEDCAAVFHAIHGADGRDATAVDRPFAWDPDLDVKKLRVGYVQAAFEARPPSDDEDARERERREEWRAFDLATLEALRKLGVDLKPIELPKLPVGPLSLIITAESAAAFDELTRSGRDDLLVRQTEDAWPNFFRQGQMVPAVAYIQANRVRTLLLREMARLTADLDAYVCPTYGGGNLLLTNLTGHPAVVVPNGFRKDGTPTSITFTGRLWGESAVLALARAYQEATGFHLRTPRL